MVHTCGVLKTVELLWWLFEPLETLLLLGDELICWELFLFADEEALVWLVEPIGVWAKWFAAPFVGVFEWELKAETLADDAWCPLFREEDTVVLGATAFIIEVFPVVGMGGIGGIGSVNFPAATCFSNS